MWTLFIIALILFVLFFSTRSDGFANAPTPPHVYTNPTSAYSNEDIAALIDTLRKDLSRYHQELPETVAKTIQDQVEPTIKGVLSRNYYVPQ
jgi:hypothetical protein